MGGTVQCLRSPTKTDHQILIWSVETGQFRHRVRLKFYCFFGAFDVSKIAKLITILGSLKDVPHQCETYRCHVYFYMNFSYIYNIQHLIVSNERNVNVNKITPALVPSQYLYNKQIYQLEIREKINQWDINYKLKTVIRN